MSEEEFVKRLEAIIQHLETCLTGLRRIQRDLSAEIVRRQERETKKQ